MIGVILHGRMGNQLFQYATALCIAKKLKTHFFIDPYKDKYQLPEYFVGPWKSYLQNRIYYSFYCRFLNKKMKTVNENDILGQYNLHNFGNGIVWDGYFQSVKYFTSVRPLIYNTFKLRKKVVKQFRKNYSDLIKANYVAIHVRRTDYTELVFDGVKKDLSLPLSYYEKCLERVAKYKPQKYVFVSDDIDWVRTNFGTIPNSIFIHDSEINDFQILLNARYIVLANSSFSWWATFLNSSKEKVYAPKYWMGYNLKKNYPYNHLLANLDYELIN